MWEDNKTRSEWVFVNRCYFPNDLPEADGRPCSPKSNEVYESNHGNTIVAGLIHGPCVVLPPSKFNEESGRRSRLGPGANDGLQPLYLCKSKDNYSIFKTCVLCCSIEAACSSESHRSYIGQKEKMERQLHHTSGGSAIITKTPPQPQDGKTMAMAQIHPCYWNQED